MENKRLIPDWDRNFPFSIMLRLTLGVTYQTCYEMSEKVKPEAAQSWPVTSEYVSITSSCTRIP
jgi:hypothetical protein